MATNVKITRRKVNDAPGNVVAFTAIAPDTQGHTQARHNADERSIIERYTSRASAPSAM